MGLQMNNIEKNASTCARLSQALLELLADNEMSDISISDITRRAGVSRNSFYRNFSTKEDVITRYVSTITRQWQSQYEAEHAGMDEDLADLFGSLFAHIKEHGDMYMLLKKRGLFICVLRAIKDICGPKKEQNNTDAYSSAITSYGIFGWIDEWLNRGMVESADSMKMLITLSPHTKINRGKYE